MTDPHRSPGKARSPKLEQLAAQARDVKLEAPAPSQASMLSRAQITRRLELATGVHGDNAGCASVVAIMLALFSLNGVAIAATTGVANSDDAVLVVVLVIAALVAIGWAVWARSATSKRRRQAIETELAWERHHPFPVTGYLDWLVNDRSLLVVELRASIERAVFVDAVATIDPAIEVKTAGERAFELVIPSRVLSGENPERFGNIPLLKRVFETLLRPLHDDVGIDRVTMGGTVVDR